MEKTRYEFGKKMKIDHSNTPKFTQINQTILTDLFPERSKPNYDLGRRFRKKFQFLFAVKSIKVLRKRSVKSGS